MEAPLEPCLYVVPTPIGNLADMTYRAVKTLQSVDAILAEDTRKTGVLLKYYEIKRPLYSHHAHNEHQKLAGLVEELKSGKRFALVTDAGMPVVSDPGFLLVRECVREGVRVECLPGATAFVPALVGAGLPADRFCFEGFLPHKKGRKTRLEALAEEERTLVFYESPHRIAKTLGQLAEFFGSDRPAAVCRELTKIHEEYLRGTLSELQAHYEAVAPKGEFVLVVGGKGAQGIAAPPSED